MITNMFSKSFKSLFFLLLFVGFSSFAQAQALNLAGCQTFSNTLGTNYMVTWGSANAAQRAQWQTSGCYTSPQAAAPVAPAPVVAAAVPFMGCQQMSNTLGTDPVASTWGTANAAQQAQWNANGCNTRPQAAAPVAPAPVVAAAVPFMGCQVMSNTLGTKHGVTWGNANAAQQAQWNASGCNTSPPVRVVGILSYQCCTKISQEMNSALLAQCINSRGADISIDSIAQRRGAIVLVAGGEFIKPLRPSENPYIVQQRCNDEFERRK